MPNDTTNAGGSPAITPEVRETLDRLRSLRLPEGHVLRSVTGRGRENARAWGRLVLDLGNLRHRVDEAPWARSGRAVFLLADVPAVYPPRADEIALRALPLDERCHVVLREEQTFGPEVAHLGIPLVLDEVADGLRALLLAGAATPHAIAAAVAALTDTTNA